MNISNWPFWYWIAVFFVVPAAFFVFAGRLFPAVKNKRLKNFLKAVDLVGLLVACITTLISFVMVWQTLTGWGYWSFLLCLTVPFALIISYELWRFGITLLLTKAEVTTYTIVLSEDSDEIQVAWVAGSGIQN